MIVLDVVVFLLVLFVVPYGMGCALIPGRDRTLAFFGGWFASLLVFHLLALIFHVTLGSLRVLNVIWCVACGATAAYGYWRRARWPKQEKRPLVRPDKLELLLLAAVLVIVVGHTVYTLLSTTYINSDDQTYCAIAADSWYTDTVNRHDPTSGVLRECFYNKPYTWSTWPVYSSLLAVLTGIHPTIIHRTLLPLFLIPLTYVLLYKLFRHFMPDSRKSVYLALIYYQMLVVCASTKQNWVSTEWWLLIIPWSGKSLTFNVVTPLVLLVLFWLWDAETPERRKACWITLFLVCAGGCCIAASVFIIVPIELAFYGIVYLWKTKRWGDIPKFLLCGALPVFSALMTLL